jgi:mannose-1-phosphate guanylyltransferase
MRITSAIVLVGGEGTRLRPLTYGTPKAMVPILNRPFLEHMLVYLRRYGITDVRLALGHQPDPIRAYFGDGSRWGIDLRMVVEAEPLGSGGAIRQFQSELKEAFFAFNGDILTDMDLGAMTALHQRDGAKISIGLIEVDDPSGFGVARLDGDGRIAQFVEKPPRNEAPSRWANAGVWLFEPEVLDRVPEGRKSMVETELFPELIADGGRVQGYCQRCFWVDIGTPQRYLDVQLRMLEDPALRLLPLSTWPGTPYLASEHESGSATSPAIGDGALVEGPVLLGAGTRVEAGARVVGPAVLGPGSVVQAGAVVERSVLWERVVVGPNARVTGTVMASRSEAGEGADLERAVVEQDARIGAHARVTNEAYSSAIR